MTPCLIGQLAGIAELAGGLFWPNDRKALMIWAYYDESGEYDQSGKPLNMTIGCCMSSCERWKHLDLKWADLLKREGLQCFHMTDFEAWVPPFDFKKPDGSRDYDRHNQILNDVLELMLGHIDGFYGFGAVSMHDPSSPELTHKSLMEDCVLGAVKHAALEAWSYYEEPISLVFAKHRHFSQEGIKFYANQYDWGRANGRISSISFADVKDVRPLQTADVFAYEMARAQRPDRPERYPFAKLVAGAKSRNLKMSLNWGPIRSGQIRFS